MARDAEDIPPPVVVVMEAVDRIRAARVVSAGELLRGYAPPGMPTLADCLPYAMAATEHDQSRRVRVLFAASVLGLEV